MPGSNGHSTYEDVFKEEQNVEPQVEPTTPKSLVQTEIVDPNVSNKVEYGNYLNFGALNRRQRKLLTKTGGQYVGSDGKVHTITAGTDRSTIADQFRAERRARRAYARELQTQRAAQSIGAEYEVNLPEFASEDAKRIYEAGLRSPGSSYFIYREKVAPKPAAEPENAPAVAETSIAEEPAISYKGFGGDNQWDKYNENFLKAIESNEGFKDFVGDDNIIGLDQIKAWQKANGLKVDGAIGWEALKKAKALGLLTEEAYNTLYNALPERPEDKPEDEVVKTKEKHGIAANLIGSYPDAFNRAFGYTIISIPQIKMPTLTYKKKGGKMKYFQAGGALNAQQVATEQAQAQQAQLTEIFMAIAKKPKETLQALAQQGVQPKQIIEIAQKMAESNPAAKEALTAIYQMSQMARRGTKLQYIKRLRGECPEGYEMKVFKAGGVICEKCMKKAVTKQEGGEIDAVAKFKEMRCGGKTKKKK